MLVSDDTEANVGLLSQAAGREYANHLFVSNVRFWSMFAIIAVHSSTAWGIDTGSPAGSEFQIALIQAVKFGTIGFYLVSGFLLGERLHRHTARVYLARRLKKVGVPWLVWASLFALVPFAKI